MIALHVKFDCKICENENCCWQGLPAIEKVCDGYKHTTTHADRVRAMSDDELEEWFWWMLKYVQGYTDSRCALRDWLKQKAEECTTLT